MEQISNSIPHDDCTKYSVITIPLLNFSAEETFQSFKLRNQDHFRDSLALTHRVKSGTRKPRTHRVHFRDSLALTQGQIRYSVAPDTQGPFQGFSGPDTGSNQVLCSPGYTGTIFFFRDSLALTQGQIRYSEAPDT